MTEVHLEDAQLKRKAIESAQKIFALVDSSKFGKEDLTLFARPEQIVAEAVLELKNISKPLMHWLPNRSRVQ